MRIGDGSGYGSLAQAAIQQRRQEMQIDGGIDTGSGTSEAKKSADTPDFASVLKETAFAASAKDHEASEKAAALAAGTSDDLHGTMITAKEADISMKLVGSVRDKLMDAFHELWRINV